MAAAKEARSATLQEVSLALLDDHPDNPRVAFREDVVTSIANQLNGDFPQQHAIHVRPVGERFQIVAGHHRTEAARRKNLSAVWAWVELLDDDVAFMQLVLSNSQGELSPLEIGIHALKAVPTEQGKKGGGLQGYAEAIGRTKQFVSQLRQAAAVVSTCQVDLTGFHDKTQHLAAIHKAPQECWENLVKVLSEQADWSAKATSEIVQEVNEAIAIIPDFWRDVCFPSPVMAAAVARRLKTAATFGRLAAKASELLAVAEEKGLREEVLDWLKVNTSADAWDIGVLQRKLIELEDIQAPSGSYDLLLVDPPWAYDFAETENRRIENKYGSLGIDELSAIEPPAAENCVLFLWATAPKLREALQLIDAWGFEYKTHGIWDKEKIGMGYWFRGRHELLLVATKGDVSPPPQESRVASIFSEARTKHSRKPNIVYELLEKMFPDKSRCIMFPGEDREGWDSWGKPNE